MKNERGFSLIEVIIAIVLLGIIAAGVLYALATTSKVLFIADERATAESLAREQMEYIKDQPYDAISDPLLYDKLSDIPQGYGIDIISERLDPKDDGFDNDDGLQKITVYIYHPDDDEEPLITLEAYKGER